VLFSEETVERELKPLACFFFLEQEMFFENLIYIRQIRSCYW